jgi:toxin FitB
MTGWLLDTNVLSELRRRQPSPNVVEFVSAQPLDSLFVSEVTFAEIRFGIELVSDPTRRADLGHWLDHRLRPMFTHRVLAISEDILLQWRLIIEAGRTTGYTFSHPDVLIAATAAHHDLTVVTRDTGDFVAAGVTVLDPWLAKLPE